MHKYYTVRSTRLAGAPRASRNIRLDKEITGIAKIPNRYRIWSGHAIDGGDVIEITESEYSTYQAFELFVEYEWVETHFLMMCQTNTVYIYDPNLYEIINGRVEPCTI